jgi:hypothetical protein
MVIVAATAGVVGAQCFVTAYTVIELGLGWGCAVGALVAFGGVGLVALGIRLGVEQERVTALAIAAFVAVAPGAPATVAWLEGWGPTLVEPTVARLIEAEGRHEVRYVRLTPERLRWPEVTTRRVWVQTKQGRRLVSTGYVPVGDGKAAGAQGPAGVFAVVEWVGDRDRPELDAARAAMTGWFRVERAPASRAGEGGEPRLRVALVGVGSPQGDRAWRWGVVALFWGVLLVLVGRAALRQAREGALGLCFGGLPTTPNASLCAG